MTPEIFDSALYIRAMRLVRSYVLQNCGTMQDAEDVLQEGFFTFFQSTSKEGFTLSTKPEYYILSVCKKLWLKELARKKIAPPTQHINGDDVIDDDWMILIKERKEQLITIIERNIKKLSTKSQKLFDYKMEGLTCAQIAELLKLKNGQIVKDKTYRCKQRLLLLISEDKDYRNLYEDGEEKYTAY